MEPYNPRMCQWAEELCGSDSAMQRVFANGRDMASVELEITYRAHPILGSIISKAFYEDRLKSGILAEQRTLITEIVELPVAGVPLIMMQVDDEHQTGSGFSLINPAQEQMAARMVKKLLELKKDMKISVICFYKSAVMGVAEELTKRKITSITVNAVMDPVKKEGGKSVEISTIDAYQGREDDMIIIVSTRSNDRSEDLDGSHLGKRGRTVVALSRAKQGMMVIGNMVYLASLTTWRKYQQASAAHMPIVDKRYIEALEQDMAPTRKGSIWVDGDGKPAFASAFQVKKKWLQEWVELPTTAIKKLKIGEEEKEESEEEEKEGEEEKEKEKEEGKEEEEKEKEEVEEEEEEEGEEEEGEKKEVEGLGDDVHSEAMEVD
uniref:DNA2/NAM7 helicase-like C-terminal domain-containing protein n=1 Tax=Panagrolaimus superbus TaxID=310955 RepID=A0A914YID6_9BILA